MKVTLLGSRVFADVIRLRRSSIGHTNAIRLVSLKEKGKLHTGTLRTPWMAEAEIGVRLHKPRNAKDL